MKTRQKRCPLLKLLTQKISVESFDRLMHHAKPSKMYFQEYQMQIQTVEWNKKYIQNFPTVRIS